MKILLDRILDCFQEYEIKYTVMCLIVSSRLKKTSVI
jgi:hypothetical protein